MSFLSSLPAAVVVKLEAVESLNLPWDLTVYELDGTAICNRRFETFYEAEDYVNGMPLQVFYHDQSLLKERKNGKAARKTN